MLERLWFAWWKSSVKQPPALEPKAEKSTPRFPSFKSSGCATGLFTAYDAVDLDVLWDTIIDDLPPLIAELEKILPSVKGGD